MKRVRQLLLNSVMGDKDNKRETSQTRFQFEISVAEVRYVLFTSFYCVVMKMSIYVMCPA